MTASARKVSSSINLEFFAGKVSLCSNLKFFASKKVLPTEKLSCGQGGKIIKAEKFLFDMLGNNFVQKTTRLERCPLTKITH